MSRFCDEGCGWRGCHEKTADCSGPLFFGGAGKGFTTFLRAYLTDADFNLIKGKFVLGAEGKRKRIRRFGHMTGFLYGVRSRVVHHAELGGIWPFSAEVIGDSTTGRLTVGVETIPPRDFRILLWRAILKSFGMDVVRW